jgi:hypothetical protein
MADFSEETEWLLAMLNRYEHRNEKAENHGDQQWHEPFKNVTPANHEVRAKHACVREASNHAQVVFGSRRFKSPRGGSGLGAGFCA